MAGEEASGSEPLEDIAERGAVRFVLIRDIPFAGVYEGMAVNQKRQATLPAHLRRILMLRQDREECHRCAVYCKPEEGYLAVKDRPSDDECPDFSFLPLDRQGRFVLPASLSSAKKVRFVGKGDYIAVYAAEYLTS